MGIHPLLRKTGERLLDEREAAELLSVKPGTLAVWRSTKRYPLPYVCVGRSIRYTESGLLAFIASRTVSA